MSFLVCRYPELFGSDDRMHACIAELGVPITKNQGFHQVYARLLLLFRTVGPWFLTGVGILRGIGE
jgi:hypothetical protein